ncbi:hypothetical protein AKJ49_01735 [candidate division MSBL1 archaeon SCGC-AAA382A03]|uniref:SIS domain-containing protein n=1 Tax=candidate division MSBL1 archaeon SCGC-AAA382A03 TaxID=1698278 RepID=A0A133VED9_9EURY|nr:hypothetical protein AKJ49_01735 [candidate division MSBL1 archaeon SCGC-AAA382A03]
MKASDKQTFCSSDSSIPYEYKPDDLVVALSSSGETERTIHYAESAYNPISESTPVVSITTNPDSTLAGIAKKTKGLVVEIPGKSKADRADYQERQFLGQHEPLTLGGTLGELYTLEFILDAIGSAISTEPVMEYHNKFWNKVKSYDPDPSQFRRLHEMLPEPINYSNPRDERAFPNKTIVGGLELSGVIARAFSIRLAHCAGEDEERFVYFYKDAGNIAARKNDLVLIFSGSGQEFWTRVLEPVKSVEAKIFAVTSFGNSPLGKMADAIIEVPGRKEFRDRSKLENPPKDPGGALYEIRSILATEIFIHCLVKEEKISIKAVESKHSQLT